MEVGQEVAAGDVGADSEGFGVDAEGRQVAGKAVFGDGLRAVECLSPGPVRNCLEGTNDVRGEKARGGSVSKHLADVGKEIVGNG